MQTEKTCKKCGILKPLSDYLADKRNKDGKQSRCRLCCNEAKRNYYKENVEKILAKTNLWKKKNKDKYYLSCQKWQGKNRERARLIKVNWKKRNPEKVKESEKRRIAANPEKRKAVQRRAYRKLYSTPKGKLKRLISNSINQSLRDCSKNRRHWENIVGYTLEDLRKHLEKQFKDGMTWGNWGRWHIDHKIPIAVFNFEKPEDEDFLRCWDLNNLRPLWASENIKKKDKIDKPFQPRLVFK